MSVLITTFDDADCLDKALVGGKAVGLAEMTQTGLPVAPGFAITSAAYRSFLDYHGVRARVDESLGHLGEASEEQLAAVGTGLTAILESAELPVDLEAQIRSAYQALCDRTGVADVAVAVRSSATAEDSVQASFAGEFETWVDVVGADSVVEHVVKCYASIYSGRVLSYLRAQSIDPHDIEMAVVIQKTVRARAAGVMFTLCPITGDRSKVSIEASWGLGLSVVGGEVTPDRYVVDKVGVTLSSKELGDKRIEYRRGDAPTPVSDERIQEFCLADEEVLALAAFGKQLERTHNHPQDIEFAVDEELPHGSHLILLQCRPETVWSQVERRPAFDAGASVMSWITGSITGATASSSGSLAPSDAHPHG